MIGISEYGKSPEWVGIALFFVVVIILVVLVVRLLTFNRADNGGKTRAVLQDNYQALAVYIDTENDNARYILYDGKMIKKGGE